jgi:hypothetical protein
MKRLIISAFIFVSAMISSFAATYYVDYSAGSDSSNGTSTSTPWQHCLGDTNATGTAASATFSPGDTVYFKGGVSYILVGAGITVAGGSYGSPVTYDGNSSGSWGTGSAIITDDFSSNSIVAFTVPILMSNVVFNSFCFTNIGGSNTIPVGNFNPNGYPAKPGSGITANTMLNVKIENCNFSRLGYWQEWPTNVNGSSLQGCAVGASICDGVTITNCEFDRIRDPVSFGVYGAWNLSVQNCFFHDEMEWGLTVLCVNSYRSNVVVSGCVFSNTDQYYVGTGAGGLYQGYNGGGPHQNAIMMFNGEGESGNMGIDRFPGDTNVLIYNNKFITTMGYPGGTTAIWLQDGTSGYIYNNLFYLSAANNAVNVSGDFTNTPCQMGIFNNTFYGGNIQIVVSSTGVPAWPSTQTSTILRVENNLISTLNIGNNNAYDYEINVATDGIARLTNSVLFDYNSYFTEQVYWVPIFALWPSVGIWGLIPDSHVTDPRQFGWEIHSVANSSPPFVSAVHVSPFNYDLHPLTNSAAIGAGTNLTILNLPGLDKDLDGNARPATGPWTIGAYNAAGTNAPAPPTTYPGGMPWIYQ